MSSASSGPRPGAIDRYAIRVHRLREKEQNLIRVLSTSYEGLLTHWVNGRGEYCAGAQNCPRSLHGRPTVWKGYFAGELWDDHLRLWFPTVMELTEGAELDVRDQFRRGQTWLFRKPAAQGDENPPLLATLHETNDPALMPRAFDILPALCTIYHYNGIKLGIDNPMPPRLMVKPSQGPAPAGKDGAETASKDSGRSVREMMDQFRQRGGLNGGGK